MITKDYENEWERLIMDYYYEEFDDDTFHDIDEYYDLAYTTDEDGFDIQVSCSIVERRIVDTRNGRTKVFDLTDDEFDQFISNLDFDLLIGGDY